MSKNREKAALEGTGVAPAPDDPRPERRRSGQVRIRLPTGEHAWVSADAFNLISEKEFRDSERLRRLRSQRNLAAVVAAFALVVFAAGAVSLLTRRTGPEQEPGAGSPAGRAGPAATASGEQTAAGDPDIREIEQTVSAWARAWSAQDVEAVLSFYSPSFLVPDGIGRAAWERLRRERITSPELLAVSVEDLTAERTGPLRAVARFLQVYDTPGYRAWVVKTLELASESGSWLIVEEAALLAEIGTGSLEGELVRPGDARPGEVTNP